MVLPLANLDGYQHHSQYPAMAPADNSDEFFLDCGARKGVMPTIVIPSALAKLNAVHHRLNHDQPNSTLLERRELPLFELGPNFELDLNAVIPWGLWPAAALASTGSVPDKLNTRPRPLAYPSFAYVGDKAAAKRFNLLEFVATYREGLISWGGGATPVEILYEIIRAFFPERIAILCRRQADVGRYAGILRRWLPPLSVTTYYRIDSHWSPRAVVIGTRSGLMCRPLDLRDVQLVIVADATDLLLRRPAEILDGCHRSLFGLLPHNTQLAPLELDRLQKIFGFAEFTAWGHGGSLRDVVVDWVSLRRATLRECFRSADVRYFRRAIWDHHARNELIVTVIDDILRGDATRVRRYSKSLARHLQQGLQPRIAVVADADEHVANLGRYRPMTHVPLRATRHAGDNRARIGPSAEIPPDSKVVILSQRALSHLRDLPCDVIIRADGGTGTLRLPPRLRSTFSMKTHPIWLLDVSERFHGLARRLMNQREAAYRAAGWYSSDADFVTERARDFLRRYPRDFDV